LISLAVVALLTATLLTASTVRVLVLLARSFIPALALSALMLTATLTLLLTAAAVGVLLLLTRHVPPTLVLPALLLATLVLPTLVLLTLLLVHYHLLELPLPALCQLPNISCVPIGSADAECLRVTSSKALATGTCDGTSGWPYGVGPRHPRGWAPALVVSLSAV
jgi:hypothetical protein